ncbi:hypothetical protein PYCCODRAFT_17715 [Trametes coccinea BRFM310]|uniref:CCHC-type domain-containing protein n=1 Tax=Trametes coccinea (strain BRFM310) TaxID=1353009 RepID=A0A1Y2J4S3_TRAC3|nr:hypothetical protein PYCCODRAFT_17715 [Trametes coccinea BRFM310]
MGRGLAYVVQGASLKSLLASPRVRPPSLHRPLLVVVDRSVLALALAAGPSFPSYVPTSHGALFASRGLSARPPIAHARFCARRRSSVDFNPQPPRSVKVSQNGCTRLLQLWRIRSPSRQLPEGRHSDMCWWLQRRRRQLWELRRRVPEDLGHISKDCPQPQRRACYSCGSEGHISRDCPNNAQTAAAAEGA